MDDELYLDNLIAEFLAEQSQRQLRRSNPHALFLIKALLPYGERGLHRKYVIDKVEQMEKEVGLPIAPKFEETIQRTFQSYSSQAAGKKPKPEDDIFFWPLGKGKGQLAVHAHKVRRFLENRGLAARH